MTALTYQYVTGHFLEVLIVLLLGLLFFRDEFKAIVYQKFGLKNGNGNGNGLKEVSSEVRRLSTYYNHDTSQSLDRIEEGIREIKHALEEFREYGIRIRKE